MSNFKLSPLMAGKSNRKQNFLWPLMLIIFVETIAGGIYLFRLHQRIDQLESQISAQNNGGKNV